MRIRFIAPWARAAGHGRFVRRVSMFLLAPALLLAACGGGEDGPPPQETIVVPPSPPARDTLSEASLAGLEMDKIGLTLAWTQGILNRDVRSAAPSRTIDAVSLERRDGFDRFVVTFRPDSNDYPGYHLEYVDEVVDCAADPSEVSYSTRGQAFLQLRFRAARAHDDDFEVTAGPRRWDDVSPNLLTVHRTCDFEGVVEWAFDLAATSFYRIIEMRDPARLVVDIQHAAAPEADAPS